MGKTLTWIGLGLLLYGVYNFIAFVIGVVVFVPTVIIMTPTWIRDYRERKRVVASAEETLEKSRQWMRDNGRADEITW